LSPRAARSAGVSPLSATRSPVGAVHRPRMSCSSGGAGHRGGSPGTLDGRATAVAAGRLSGQIWELEPVATSSQLRAPRRRRSAPLCSPASVVVCGGAWLVAGLVRSSSSPHGAADAGGAC
jgi:hypothetical protein